MSNHDKTILNKGSLPKKIFGSVNQENNILNDSQRTLTPLTYDRRCR